MNIPRTIPTPQIEAQELIEEGKDIRLEQDETSKWELDTKPLLDEFYHELLGETEIEGGTWKRDPKKTRRMNEFGASVMKQEIITRINKSMALSSIKEEFIRETCKEFGKLLPFMIFDNLLIWEVNPLNKSNYESICNMMVEQLYINLSTARDGGMRKHRERSKFPNLIPQQQQQQMEQGGVM